MQRDFDLVGVAVHRLIDGIVEDFPHEVVKSGRPVPPMYMPGVAHGIEAFEDGDAAGVVGSVVVMVILISTSL